MASRTHGEPVTTPRLAALGGAVAAALALALGHLAAAIVAPGASPVVVVGSQIVDLAPTPVKNAVIGLLGTADKPFLIGAVTVVVIGFGALIGLLARLRPTAGRVAVFGLGLIAMVLAGRRGSMVDVLPSVVSAFAGALTLGPILTSTRPEEYPGGPRISRRTVFRGVLAGGVVAVLATGAGQLLGAAGRVVDTARRAITLPTPRSRAKALPEGVQAPGDTPFTTPNDTFYRIDISLLVPSHQVEGWSLTIDGMVDRPLQLSYDDLLGMDMIERDITIACVSNEVGGDLIGTARWQGVRIADLLERVGVQAGADQVFSHSLEAGFTCSTPLAALTDGRDAMIALGMNGEPLPDRHGFPARMIVPGLFGYVSATKWLSRLQLTSYAEEQAYWTVRGWAIEGPVLTQSRIDVPSDGGQATKGILAGVAWAMHRGIDKVEVRIDDGPWQPAQLADSGGIDVWRQWWLPTTGISAGSHTATVRATDGTGAVQTQDQAPVFPSGATGWDSIRFTI